MRLDTYDFYLASKKPQRGLWPSDVKRQADVLRWLAWESAHWDAESIGMVGYEKTSRRVLGLGPADPAFIARGEQTFDRFAAVLNQHLKSRTWLTGNDLTIADFSVWWNDVFCDAVGASDDEVPGDLTRVRQAGGVAGMAGVDSSAVCAPIIEMSRIFLEKTSRSMSIRRHSLRLYGWRINSLRKGVNNASQSSSRRLSHRHALTRGQGRGQTNRFS